MSRKRLYSEVSLLLTEEELNLKHGKLCRSDRGNIPRKSRNTVSVSTLAKRNAATLAAREGLRRFVKIKSREDYEKERGIFPTRIRKASGGEEAVSVEYRSYAEAFESDFLIFFNNFKTFGHLKLPGGRDRIGHDTSTECLSNYNQAVSSVEESKKLYRELHNRALRTMGVRDRILHDIWETPQHMDRQLFAEAIRNLCENKKGIFIIAEHNSHWHVVHDCQYTNSQCRCRSIRYIADQIKEETDDATSDRERQQRVGRRNSSAEEITESSQDEDQNTSPISVPFLQKSSGGVRKRRRTDVSGDFRRKKILRTIRRFARRRYVTNLYGTDHFYSLFNYFSQDQRRLLEAYVGGEKWISGGEIISTRFRRCFAGAGLQQKLASCSLSFDCGTHESGNEDTRPGESFNVEPQDHTVKTTNEQNNFPPGPKGMEKFIRSIICTPLKNILYTNFWTTSRFKYVPHESNLLKTIFHNIQQEITDKSVKEIFMYTRTVDINKLIYMAKWNTVSDYYFNLKESIIILDKFLHYQEEENVQNFLQTLYDFLEQVKPKKNCLYIVSPPNAGKNFFFDAVIHSMLNFGQMANFNKYNNFPLEAAVNKRIILWNEPNYEPAALETLKMLFAGDGTPVKVKYKDPVVIRRTPILILSNNDCIPTTGAFQTRVDKFTWKTAPILKNIKKRPLPFAIFYLFIKYKIMNVHDIQLTDEELQLIG